MQRKWRIASEDEIQSGKTTDIYFERAVDVIKKEGLNPRVYAEVTVSGMPQDMEWGVVAGINDTLKLFEGKNVTIRGLPEGTVFYPRSRHGVKIPVLSIEGPYTEFAILETPMLGFICHTSGMVTRTAMLRLAAGEKALLSFGARRTHPAITPQVEYAAYIGGCDGVSCVLGAGLLGIKPSGTMPHALVIAFEDQVKAWQAFDKHVSKEVPRIAIADTYLDEVVESIRAAESVEDLNGVRIDTTSSRRGNLKRIIEEVRWELDIRGYQNVKIYASGGLDHHKLRELSDAPVDGFGVGGAISNASAIDFAMDIVALYSENRWKPVSKRGKFSGRKTVVKCEQCGRTGITIDATSPECEFCHGQTKPVTITLLEDGKSRQKKPNIEAIKKNIRDQLTVIGEQTNET